MTNLYFLLILLIFVTSCSCQNEENKEKISYCKDHFELKIDAIGCYLLTAGVIVLMIIFLMFIISQIGKCRKSHKMRKKLKQKGRYTEEFKEQSSVIQIPLADPNQQRALLDNPMSIENLKFHLQFDEFQAIQKDQFTTIDRNARNLKENFSVANRNPQRNLSDYVMPYDRNRVKLVIQEGDNDYVNASWMRDLQQTLGRPIIVTGYPRSNIGDRINKSETILAYWQMIFDLKVSTIVMLIDDTQPKHKNFRESLPRGIGSGLCLDLKINNSIVLSVRLDQEIINDRITVRHIKITSRGVSHEVKHLQITREPNYGELQEITEFVEDIFTTWTYTQTEDEELAKKPIVIQDDLGIKLSAIYLSIVALNKEEETKGTINVPKFVMSLRKDRMGMIEKFEDYMFLYYCCSVMKGVKKNDNKSNLLNVKGISKALRKKSTRMFQKVMGQIERADVDEMLDQFNKLDGDNVGVESKTAGNLPANRKWNRNQAVVPYDFNRVILKVEDDEFPNDYINASIFSCEDFYVPDLIVSQAPSSDIPGSVQQFWRMVVQTERTVIILLDDDESIADYLPRENPLEIGNITFSAQSTDEMYGGYFTNRVLMEDGEYARKVDHLHLTNWPDHGFKKDKLGEQFLETLEEIWDMIHKDSNVIIHCKEGIKRSGLFLVLSVILKRNSVKDSDVYNIIDSLRKQRDKMVPEIEDVQYILKLARINRLRSKK